MLTKKLISSVDELKVGHHGEATSSSSAFIKKAKPKYAVISVGKNSYGQPPSTVVKRLKSIKAVTYRTDKYGNIIFTSTGRKFR